MTVNELIAKLHMIKNKDKEVIIDFEKDEGWYSLEEVEIVTFEKHEFLNLRSSNEL